MPKEFAAFQQDVGWLGQVGPGQAGPLPVLTMQHGQTRNLQRPGKSVSSRRKEDLPATVLPGLLQGRSHRMSVVLDAIAFRPTVLDVEDSLGPLSRYDDAHRHRLAPCRGAAQSAVKTELILTRRKVVGQR